MESLPASIRDDLSRYRQRTHARALQRLGLILASLVAVTAGASEPPRFQLVGTGRLTMEQPTQKSGNVQLTARLTPSDAALSASPPVQEGGSFALLANLAAASLVCFNDTIFRDDFDGDGF
jgi:hypothetical protein